MDTEKICRTCLALSGPLLTIFDGGENGIAQMLGHFMRKPRVDDNLPSRVCLNCISEINHCYSFKLKCDNSERTLRQVLPDALAPEDYDENKSNRPAMVSREVQTAFPEDELSKSQIEQANTIEMEQCPSREMSEHVISADEVKQFTVKRKLQNNAEVTEKQPSKIVKWQLDPKQEIIEEVEEDEFGAQDYLLEIQQEVLADDRHIVERSEPEEDAPTYYEITFESKSDKEKLPPTNTETEFQFDDVEIQQLIYDEVIPGETGAEGAEYGTFTAVENDEEEELPKNGRNLRTRTPKNTEEPKMEHACPKCVMSFFSKKHLMRHLMKRHGCKHLNAMATVEEIRHAKLKATMRVEQEMQRDVEAQAGDLEENVDEKKSVQDGLKPTSTISQNYTPQDYRYHCLYCNAGFAQAKSLISHEKLGLCRIMKNIKCTECDRVFVNEEAMREHLKEHLQPINCTECETKVKTQEELIQHMINVHNRSVRNQCEVCKKVFTMSSALREHLRIHSGEKPFLCTICGKAFRQNSNLNQHLARHVQHKKFKCEHCKNAYVTKAELYSHMRTHTGDAPFKCEFCNSCFTTGSSLTKHRRKHTGERPYACDICPLRFMALNVLKNHRRTHTGEKPYKCSQCPKRFIQHGDCIIHQRTHTGERSHVCACGNRYFTASTLRTHKKMHPECALGKNTKNQEEGEGVMIEIASGEEYIDEDA